ncbi:aryl-sulfate sulfotransferase [Psychroserpens sp. SPM9]|uniref:aryl-sulfate sulfotransferase n=1 Tax=Psychroserpens sp. SPM9 TaxID=2975598 RepID=UPI0021A4DBC1|nr:aryl-sulfate sulfotransferase [Psychroserpens sp. SPM9]MDG5492482.1 aryl-sulfate sulfotransferase [Psychroserpens sp. SPM9]
MKKKLLLYFTFILFSVSQSQNTVGTIAITEDAFDAYTLITAYTKSYLFNNCGEIINQWESAYPPGNAVYLLPNGNLLRAGRVTDTSSNITFGGQGGVIELFNWEGDLIWSYLYNTNDFRQHHDIYPMPNGNVLILAVTTMTAAEAIDAGRDPNNMNDTRLYNERIFEVEPVGVDQANVVWDWNVKDHLIQDFDPTKDNFGDVAMSPGKLDINFLNGGSGSANWLHFNSIQYDENLDQIVISSRNLSEIYIIDHSTTIAESATSTGGTYGKGGDFLYRWGNPLAYKQGTPADQTLFGQHYAHYIESGLVDAGKLLIFNNGNGRFPEYSEATIIDPPTTAPGIYDYTPNTAYGPLVAEYSYSDQSTSPSEFYSPILSSAQRLPNGNLLICEGRSGEIFEIDSNENEVWRYVNPVNNGDGSTTNQGNPPPANNPLFRAIKYPTNYAAFTGRDLTPGNTLELNPDLTPCENLSVDDLDLVNFKIYPNPTSNLVHVSATNTIDKIELYSMLGQKIHEATHTSSIDISSFNSGVYFIQIYAGKHNISKKIIKQ